MNFGVSEKPLTPTLSRKGRGSQSELNTIVGDSQSKLGITPSPLAGEGWGEGSNHRTYSPYLKEFSRSLRKNQTDAENKIWSIIRSNQLGHKFRRQFAIDNKSTAIELLLRNAGAHE